MKCYQTIKVGDLVIVETRKWVTKELVREIGIIDKLDKSIIHIYWSDDITTTISNSVFQNIITSGCWNFYSV